MTGMANKQPNAGRLPRQVRLLGWVSFFQDVSGEMVTPVIPLFLVGALGASATSLGWVDGVATAAVALMTAWVGWRSDRVVDGKRRRVPWIRWGYGLPIVGKLMLTSAFAWPMVLAGRSVDRIGKGVRSSTRDALIAEAVPSNERGRAFGFHRAMDAAGSVVGVLAAAALLWWLVGSPVLPDQGMRDIATPASLVGHGSAFRLIFAIAAGLGVIAWGLTLFVQEIPPSGAIDATANASQSASPTHLSPAYWRTVALMLVFALANSSDMFLVLRAREVGFEPWKVGVAYALMMLTQTAFSQAAGVVSDRIGRWQVIRVGWAIYACVYAGLAFTGARGIWPLLALYGVYLALTDGVAKALVADHAPAERRGAALGIFYMANGLVTLVASVVAGALWDRVSPAAAFGFGAGVAVLALALTVSTRGSDRR